MEQVFVKSENIKIEVKLEPLDSEDAEADTKPTNNFIQNIKIEQESCKSTDFSENIDLQKPHVGENSLSQFQGSAISQGNLSLQKTNNVENSLLFQSQFLQENFYNLNTQNVVENLQYQSTSSSIDVIGKVYENGKINRLQCVKCDKTFKNRANLKNHMKYVHSEDQSLECSECLRSFKSQPYLRSHINSVHAKTEEVQCEHCQKVFMNKKKLNNHIYYTHRQPEEQVSCKICFKTYKGPYNLKIHMRYVHPEGDPHPCPFCYKTFKVEMLLQRHMKWAHPDDGMIYKCQECNKILPSMDCYKTHMKNVHLFERATCDICRRTFKTKKSLERHLKNIHNGKEDAEAAPYVPGEHKCQYCDRSFISSTSLFWHIERYHAQAENLPNNFCIICKKDFSDYAALHRHLTSVHSLETATCKICMKEFKSPINLQNHIRITHAPPEATTTCETCQKTFKCALHLRMHMLAVHDGGEYPCDICQKTFASTKYLNKHKKSHSDSRNHQCDICLKMYKNLHSVNKHKKHVHNGIKCSICNIKQPNLDDHMKKCHPEVLISTSSEIAIDEVTCSKCDKKIESFEYKEHSETCEGQPIVEVTIKTEVEDVEETIPGSE